jgi:hypothetical protein
MPTTAVRASSRASLAATTSLDAKEVGPVALDDGHEAVFDRYYLPTGDARAVFVDTVPDGLEGARQEAEKQVALKRKWCKKRGVTHGRR